MITNFDIQCIIWSRINILCDYWHPREILIFPLQLEASETKWVNSILIITWVNSLRLDGLQLFFSQLIPLKVYLKIQLKGYRELLFLEFVFLGSNWGLQSIMTQQQFKMYFCHSIFAFRGPEDLNEFIYINTIYV